MAGVNRLGGALTYSFHGHTLDPARRELRRGNLLLSLEPQVFDLLLYLLRHGDRVVSRDEVLEAVWGGRIVSESTVASRINAARKAIGDSGRDQRLIRTFPRRGLRFIGAVTEDDGAARGIAPPRPPQAAVSLPPTPSIAVLSFGSAGDAEEEHLADALAREIIRGLAQLRWLAVVAHPSGLASKGKSADLRQIARGLGVRYLLEGSVRRDGDGLRLAAALVDGAAGRYLWAERYDRDAADAFAAQDKLAEAVVAAVEPRLCAAEDARARRKPSEALDAWECIVRALSLVNDRSKTELELACGLLKKSIRLDPGCARGYSALSYVLTLSSNVIGYEPWDSVVETASAAARTALLIDDDDPWSHLAAGFLLFKSGRIDEGLKAYERALALDANFAGAHNVLATSLCFLGESRAAAEHIDKAQHLGLRDLFTRGNRGQNANARAFACFVDGRYREGIGFARQALAESPGFASAHRILVANYALADEPEQAELALQRLRRLVPDTSLETIARRLPFARTDERERVIGAFGRAGLK